MPDLGVICELCKERVDASNVFDHFTDKHGLGLDGWELETWPDGEIVIHDHTLMPEDFTT